MKHMRRLICMALMIETVLSLSVSPCRRSTFGGGFFFCFYVGFGVLPLQHPMRIFTVRTTTAASMFVGLSTGTVLCCFSTTQTGVMKGRLARVQLYVNVSTSAGGYGVVPAATEILLISSGTTSLPSIGSLSYTSAEDMETQGRQHRTLLKIPSLDINMKVL